MSEEVRDEGVASPEGGGAASQVSGSRPGAPSSVPDSAALDGAVRRESARRTRRSFVIAAAAAASGYGFYRWIDRSEGDELLQRPLREALNSDAAIARALFDERGMAPTYPVAQSKELRVNGNYGIKEEIAPENYRLQVVGVEQPKRFAQYANDVTAWDYKFAAKAKDKAHEGHDTKVTPKDEGGAGSAAADGSTPAAGFQLPPEFQAAFARLKKEQGDKRPRGQEEAGKSDSTLATGTPGLLLTMDDVLRLPRHELVTQFKMHRGLERDCALGRSAAARFHCGLSAGEEREGSGAVIRLHGDSRRRLLLRLPSA